MWDQPYKSSRSHEKQSNYYRAAPKYSSQVPRDYRDTHLSSDYISSPTDSSFDYITPRRGSYENSPPNYRQYVNRAMDYDHTAQPGRSRDGNGFSQPRPGYQPRPSRRPHRTRSQDSDYIAQDSQSDDDYIASPEVKRNVRADRKSSYDDRYSDDSLGQGSPIHNSSSRNYSESPPSDYAPHHETRNAQKIKAGWGDSVSHTQSQSLNPREHDNYREAKQFLERYTKLHTHTADRSDTESYSTGDSSPANRQDKSYRQYPNPQQDDEVYHAPSRDNYRERHHNQRARSRHTSDYYHRPEDNDDDDDYNQRNRFEPRTRNLDPRYNDRPGSFYSDADDQHTSTFSAPHPLRHVDRSSNRPGSVYLDRKDDTHAATAYSDIASRPSTSHSDRLSRVPTAVDSENYSSPPPAVPSPPLYRRQQRPSGSDYGAMPGAWGGRSRSRSRSAYASERSTRSRSPYASPSRRSIHTRNRRMIGSYRSDSDENGVAEGDDYLPSDSDDDRISVDDGGRSDVCEKDSWAVGMQEDTQVRVLRVVLLEEGLIVEGGNGNVVQEEGGNMNLEERI
ncbi:uncharacterized protein ALTATR162_LOCUS9957 [Alternaria atra]|uniref:Uncharacterized protein n=1 Tax=Alternaria atra TaxID=119953 RepID=A0A8J2NA62_9PLEO|nr:uncharacterized protein ALTATR162_LOCUS9957 [Alternaria atra]CAG5182031.1 unnamed protein product [Alternaria atra]